MSSIAFPFDKSSNNKFEVNFKGTTNIGHLQIGDVIYKLPTKDDPSEIISVVIIEVNYQNIEESLQQCASLISVRLAEGKDKFPFVPPKEFEMLKNKVLLYGINGCGKTRCIYEILEKGIKNKSYGRIIVICNNNSSMSPSIKITAYELITKVIRDNDIIIWDNFPEGYINGQNITLGNNKLIEISGKVKNLIISVKADYIEDYWSIMNNLPEMDLFHIVYGKGEIKQVLEKYGKSIKKFSQVYEQVIEKSVDDISRILHSIEPLPSSIYIYYSQIVNSLNNKNIPELYGIKKAKEFNSSSHYYKNQFEILNRRIHNLEIYSKIYFLFTLKLCYELGLDRTRRFMMQLQRDIFDVAPPPNPLIDLSIWIEFSSGKYYSMSNVAKNSIEYPLDRLPDIINYLTDGFNEFVTYGGSTIYLLGVFFGKNINILFNDEDEGFLPSHIYNYMKNQAIFASGIGDGIGESFLSIENEDLQNKLLHIAVMEEDEDKNFSSFPVRFGIQLGIKIFNKRYDIQQETINKILELTENDTSFTKGVAFGLGVNFQNMDKDIQIYILNKINEKDGLNLYIGFANGIRYIFIDKDKDIQKFVLNKINKNNLFSLILGSSLGFFLFTKIDLQTVNDIIIENNWISWGIGQRVGVLLNEMEPFLSNIEELINSNKSFCDGLCYGISTTFELLTQNLKNFVWLKVKENKAFAEGMGFYIAENFPDMKKELEDEIFNSVQDNIYSCVLMSRLAYLYNLQNKSIQDKIWNYVNGEKIEYYFGFFLANNFTNTKFTNLNNEMQEKIQCLIKNSKFFKIGLNNGLAYYGVK